MSQLEDACLILGYARVEGLLGVLDSAIKAACPRIYISIDGSIDPSVQENQRSLMRQIRLVSENSTSQIIIRHSQKNFGVAGGVISGIDWFFQNEEFGAILEDDLQVSENFFLFVQKAKELLRENPDYLMISGCRFSPEGKSISLTNYPLIWGWATSKENWLCMRNAIVHGPSFKGVLDYESSFWLAGALRVKYGVIDTWDIPLVLNFRQQKKYCLIPPVNLISNVGNDSFAIHTNSDHFPLNHPLGLISSADISLLTLDTSSSVVENMFLKKFVYRIRYRHIFSVLKFYFELMTRPARFKPLKSRLV